MIERYSNYEDIDLILVYILMLCEKLIKKNKYLNFGRKLNN